MIASSKVALITGAATGIGRAIAIRLAKEGASVAINYVGSATQADEVVKEIEAKFKDKKVMKESILIR